MKSKEYHYWVSQCQKGFKLEDNDDSYQYLADETLYIDYDLYVYRVDDVIYAVHYKEPVLTMDGYYPKDIDYNHYIIN